MSCKFVCVVLNVSIIQFLPACDVESADDSSSSRVWGGSYLADVHVWWKQMVCRATESKNRCCTEYGITQQRLKSNGIMMPTLV